MFLDISNVKNVVKRIYNKHRQDGGEMTIGDFQNKIPKMMHSWNKLLYYQSYESLVNSIYDELEQMNRDFINDTYPQFHHNNDYKTIVRLRSPEDYHNLSTTTREDVLVKPREFQKGLVFNPSKIPPPRWYDGNEGILHASYASRDAQVRDRGYDIDETLAFTNKPYHTVDEYEDDYYGQLPMDSQVELISTTWKTSTVRNPPNYRINIRND